VALYLSTNRQTMQRGLRGAPRLFTIALWLQVTEQTSSWTVLPYPIPPAGFDFPSNWQPDEEPLPFTVSWVLEQQLLVPPVPHVGWWDQGCHGLERVRYQVCGASAVAAQWGAA